MQLTIALEHRFWQTPDGAFRTDTGFARSFWSRYLTVFDSVRILARVAPGTRDHEGLARVDGGPVSLLPLPSYVGPAGFLRKWLSVYRSVRSVDFSNSAVILRVPGLVGSLVRRVLPRNHPYAVEVVGDPFDVFAPGANDHPLRPFFRWWFQRELRSTCLSADCSLYVTQKALQDRYPPGQKARVARQADYEGGGTVGVSDVEMRDVAYVSSNVELGEDAFVGSRANSPSSAGPLRVICVGTLEQLYKRQDLLVRAVAMCVRQGMDMRLTLVGGGRMATAIKKLAEQEGIADRVVFAGSLSSGAMVRDRLDESDLFVLPSRQEGLPRAMVEAMARGLPCIGARVGGIPELLPDYALVSGDDAEALADRMATFARDPVLRVRAGRENLRKAHAFHEHLLQPRRVAFYRRLEQLTIASQKLAT